MKGEDKLLTILVPVEIIGDDGISKLFTPYNQYCYVNEGYIYNTGSSFVYGYEFTDKDINYIIDAVNVEPCSKERTEKEKVTPFKAIIDKRYEKMEKDHKKRTKEVLGLDIEAHEKTDFNGRWLERIINSKS